VCSEAAHKNTVPLFFEKVTAQLGVKERGFFIISWLLCNQEIIKNPPFYHTPE